MQARHQCVITPLARPQRVGHDAADDAALYRPLQRGDHPLGDRIVGDDVEEQTDMRARGVDVGDEAVDDHVIVGQDFDRVAAQDRQVAKFFGEAYGGCRVAVLLRMRHIRMRRKPGIDGTGELGKCDLTPQTPCGNPAAAEDEIECDPDYRLEQDQQQPALRCIR